MEQVFKTGITLFLLIIFLLMGLGVVVASMDSVAAEQYTTDAAAEIEAYNFNKNVINSCINNADTKGYKMTVTPVDTDGDGRTDMAEIITEYKYSLFNNDSASPHYVRVYAR